MLQRRALTRRESQVMDIVYSYGEASATKVMSEMPDHLSRAAVRTFLKLLEQKGYLIHRQEGREYFYAPTEERGQAGRLAMRQIVDVFFGGSIEKAMATYLAESGNGNKMKMTVQSVGFDASSNVDISVHNGVTKREREVLQLLAEGQSTKAIAEQLGISRRTVEAHRLHITTKLKMRSIAELTKYAIRERLVLL
jgi:BlaI family penicillinase repressor